MDKTQEVMTEGPEALTRREVLKTAAGAGLVLLLPMFAPPAHGADPWTTVGTVKQFRPWQPQRIALPDNGEVLYITRTGAKTLTAVSAKCTHRGCEVGWNGTEKQLQCPCHGAAFGSSGKNIHGTRRSPGETLPPLAAVPIRQKGIQVQVNLQTIPAEALHSEQEG